MSTPFVASILAISLLQSGGGAPSTYTGPSLPSLDAYSREAIPVEGGTVFWQCFESGMRPMTEDVPADARPWEPKFQNLLQDGNRVLNSVEILRLREALALLVYHDSRIRPSGPRTPKRVAQALDSAIRDASNWVGIEEPSSELRQVLMGEAVSQYVMRWNNYRAQKKKDPTRETPDYLLNVPDENRFVCHHSSLQGVVLLRELEALNRASSKPTGLIAEALNGTPSHAWMGLSIKCRDGLRMKVQFDGVAASAESHARTKYNRRERSNRMGPLSRIGVELFLQERYPMSVRMELNKPKNRADEDRRWSHITAWGVETPNSYLAAESRFLFGLPLRLSVRPKGKIFLANTRETYDYNAALWKARVHAFGTSTRKLSELQYRFGY